MKNLLFFIGIDKYKSLNNLNSCVKDCNDIRDILVDKYGFSSENVTEIYNENATNLKIQEKFKDYIKKLTFFDNLIIYYSGHGGFDKTTEKGYWVPHDSDPENFTTWIANDIILSYIKQINAKHILIISDSCFSRSILITEPTKSIFSNAKDYDTSPSRWGLTSGAEECRDGDPGSNTYFGEVILDILKANKDDLRVSALIDKVKTQFDTNLFQKPQGYPLNDPKHRGGEFIFKISSDFSSESETLKGYKDFSTILKFYKHNSDFKELSYFENKTLKIGYQIFQEHDEVLKKVTYYLMLFEGINQLKTQDHLRQNHPIIFKEKALIILIPQERKRELANPNKRKQNIKEKFQPLNIFYVDEFIRDQCNPKNLKRNSTDKYLDIENFIFPSFGYDNEIIEDTEFIKKWLEHENEPIMVLKGEGGIGKTTFAQFIADKFLKLNSQSIVLFIDSSEIRNELIKREKNYDNISVYNFYEALYDSSGDSPHDKLTEDLFRINLDAGNILLIVDGLDEVISKVPKFNVDDFLNSIIDYTSDIGNGKTIITCRSYFWEVNKFSSSSIKTVDIFPFNETQTIKFFEKSFNSEKSKINKAKKIAEEFKFNDDKGSFFHPYVLDVVRTIVESDQSVIANDSTFSSNILENSVKNDYIIYRICYRERLRVEQISVDEQVEFFLYWSIKRRGVINLENFDLEITEALGRHIDKTTIEAFKSHPFIQVTAKNVRFKYDFFADYFKCIYVSRHLILDSQYETIGDDFLKIISENCWFGSSMVSDIRKRSLSWTENELLKSADLGNQILNSSISTTLKRKCLSALFNICLSINIRYKSNTITQNTDLIKALYSKNSNEIIGFHFINALSSEELVRFDFSDLVLRDCFFDNYQGFWSSKFNENTFFINCYLLNLEFDLKERIPIPKQNFQNCTTDPKFSSAFKLDEQKDNTSGVQVRDYLSDFFGLFYSRGMLQSQTLNKPHTGKDHYPSLNKKYASMAVQLLTFEEAIELIKAESLLEQYFDFAEEKIKIVPAHKNDVLKFIKDGTISNKINNLITKINNKVRA